MRSITFRITCAPTLHDSLAGLVFTILFMIWRVERTIVIEAMPKSPEHTAGLALGVERGGRQGGRGGKG